MQVLAHVPRWLDANLRGDVCQELIALLLEGRITGDQIAEYTKIVIRQQRSPYHPKRFVSLADTIGGSDLTYADVISDEYYRERMDSYDAN